MKPICPHKGYFYALISGVYYKNLCAGCLSRLQNGAGQPSSGHASFNRQQDLIDHQADVQQPYVGGKPNEQFIRAYPNKAKEIFSPDELRNYG